MAIRPLDSADVADAIAYAVTRPGHVAQRDRDPPAWQEP
jgi:hypothetical protein